MSINSLEVGYYIIHSLDGKVLGIIARTNIMFRGEM